jgi:medium-chain acyl-[acyl-carrier-protein] hydrolase
MKITSNELINWFMSMSPNIEAPFRLYCFAYAGGNPQIFRTWVDNLPRNVEIIAVQMPGHGSRLHEKPYTRIPVLVKELIEIFLAHSNKPFAFFGYSMGAIVAFELTRELQRGRNLLPKHLFVAGRRAPQVNNSKSTTYHLPESEFLEELRRLNGTPKEILENKEMMQLMLPILRADLECIETYEYIPGPPLDCPITIYGGTDDKEANRCDLLGWREHTKGSFNLKIFHGDHFFLHSARTPLLEDMSEKIQVLLKPFRR